MDTMTQGAIVGVGLVLGGLLLLYFWKYKIAIGGTRYKAEIVRVHSEGPRRVYTVRFMYHGKPLLKDLNAGFHDIGAGLQFSEKEAGDNIVIYYNEKHPNQVVWGGINKLELMALLLIGAGGIGILRMLLNF